MQQQPIDITMYVSDKIMKFNAFEGELYVPIMPGDRCTVCGNGHMKDLNASFHCFRTPVFISSKQGYCKEKGYQFNTWQLTLASSTN